MLSCPVPSPPVLIFALPYAHRYTRQVLVAALALEKATIRTTHPGTSTSTSRCLFLSFSSQTRFLYETFPSLRPREHLTFIFPSPSSVTAISLLARLGCAFSAVVCSWSDICLVCSTLPLLHTLWRREIQDTQATTCPDRARSWIYHPHRATSKKRRKTYAKMGRGKMDEAAAERIRKARGEKVTHVGLSVVLIMTLIPLFRMTLRGGPRWLHVRTRVQTTARGDKTGGRTTAAVSRAAGVAVVTANDTCGARGANKI